LNAPPALCTGQGRRRRRWAAASSSAWRARPSRRQLALLRAQLAGALCSWGFHVHKFEVATSECEQRSIFKTPEATNTGPGFNRGSGGGARGCGFGEQVGAYRRGGGLELELIQYHMAQKPVLRGEVAISLGPWPLFAPLKVTVYFFKTRQAHFPAQFSNTPNTRMPPPRCP